MCKGIRYMGSLILFAWFYFLVLLSRQRNLLPQVCPPTKIQVLKAQQASHLRRKNLKTSKINSCYALSTLRRRNLKTEVLLWKRIKCFPSTLSLILRVSPPRSQGLSSYRPALPEREKVMAVTARCFEFDPRSTRQISWFERNPPWSSQLSKKHLTSVYHFQAVEIKLPFTIPPTKCGCPLNVHRVEKKQNVKYDNK